MHPQVKEISLREIEAARARLAGLGTTMSPLLPCAVSAPGKTIRLKLECLQPIGSFKLRPIGNAVLSRPAHELARGIYTTSSGNSALGVAWMARRLGLVATAIVPQDAPQAKLEKLRALGARIDVRTAQEWWRAIEAGARGGEAAGLYIDAVRDPAALAGDATIGLEILEEWPQVEAILVPFGGGGLACGIACAVRALGRDVRVIACELDSAHPLKAAREAGGPVATAHDAGFVSGVGYGAVLPEMWPLLTTLIDEVLTVSLADVAHTIRTLIEHSHIVAEGAGAVSVAAALAGHYLPQRVCAVVSGGNIDRSMLATILAGGVPGREAPQQT